MNHLSGAALLSWHAVNFGLYLSHFSCNTSFFFFFYSFHLLHLAFHLPFSDDRSQLGSPRLLPLTCFLHPLFIFSQLCPFPLMHSATLSLFHPNTPIFFFFCLSASSLPSSNPHIFCNPDQLACFPNLATSQSFCVCMCV